MQFDAAGASDKGIRDKNQDAVGLFEEQQVFAIADGMGGLSHGEKISAAAIEAVRRAVPTLRAHAESLIDGEATGARRFLFDAVEGLFNDTCTELFSMMEREGARMGTTLTACVMAGDRMVVGHVGDTRVYRVREGEAQSLTNDHSVAAAQLRRGKISYEEYCKSPRRSILYQSLGPVPEIEPDVIEVDLESGDTVVLCCDGVWAHLADAEIAALTCGSSSQEAARAIVESAISRGSDDNCTAIVIRVLGIDEAGAPLPKALASSFLFRDLSEADLRMLAPYVHHVDVAEGDYVVREGDHGTEMFIVESGAVEVSRGGIPLTQLGPGAHFGELALATEGLRTASIKAAWPTRLLVLDRGYMDVLCDKRPDLAVRVMRTLMDDLANRLTDFAQRIGRAEQALWGS